MPEFGLTGIGASIQYGVSNAFRAEYKDDKVRVNEYRIKIMVAKDHNVKQAYENPSSKVGAALLKLATSNVKDKTVVLPTADVLEQHKNGNF